MKGGTIRVAVVLFVFTTLMVLPVWAAEGPAEEETAGESLAGLEAIAVMVMPTSPDAERNGLKREQIDKDIKLQLRKAGIKILTEREMERPGFPYLDVSVNATKDKNPELYSYNIKAALFIQAIINPEDAEENIGFALFDPIKTWSSEVKGTTSAGDLKSNVQKQLDDTMTNFIKAYFAANPKEGSTP